MPRVSGHFRQTLFRGIQLLQHDHGYEYVVFLKAKNRRWIVHQNIRIENEQMSAGQLAFAHLGYFTGAIMASRFRSSQKSMKSPRTDAIAESAGMPIVMCNANMAAPVCGAG